MAGTTDKRTVAEVTAEPAELDGARTRAVNEPVRRQDDKAGA
ncbi:hypothetical protein [Streptomyces flavofungini]|nr:hypothetical protein [Streptomyces flavofungini]WJV50928.1 hypothetical protein QUY26_38775 [Streptomyces flavofungini]